MIKYLGSKRLLVGVLGALASVVGAKTALDLFTGTTRVAQEFCRREAFVTAVDTASYSEVLARTYVELDADRVDPAEVNEALARLAALPSVRGYVTEVFCERARFFHPENGARIDAIRAGIDRYYPDSWLRPVLLTALLEAADRVDSTLGLQMAYLKSWAPRALRPLMLTAPSLTPGTGQALRADARVAAPLLPRVDLAYLDPPYNQHRYFTNYHVWETLIRWDAPPYYGVACKRLDARDDRTRSPFNSRRTMANALSELIADVRADVVAVSFSSDGFLPLPELVAAVERRGQPVTTLAFDFRRHVCAKLGVHNGLGQRVGVPGPARNTEFLVVAGPADVVAEFESVTADGLASLTGR